MSASKSTPKNSIVSAPEGEAVSAVSSSDSPSGEDSQKSPSGVSGSRSRAWFIRLSNPAEYLNMPGASEEELVDRVIDLWCLKKNGQPNYEKRGASACFEVGEQGTPHIHASLVASSRVYFSTVKKCFPNANIAMTRGSVQEQRDYLNKAGKYANTDKAHTSVVKEVHRGLELIDGKAENGASSSGGGYAPNPYSRTSTLKDIDDRLNAGVRPGELMAESVRFASMATAINETYYARIRSTIPVCRELVRIYHCGEAGSGKSYNRVAYEENDPTSIYVPPAENMWDQYQGEAILFLDDFRGERMRWEMLLNVLDVYRLQLPARYANKQAAWTRVEITSTVPLELLYPKHTGGLLSYMTNNMTEDEIADLKTRRHDNFDQLMRRIDWVHYHYIDPFYEGDQKYQFVAIPGRAYKNIDQCIRLAEARLARHREIAVGGLFAGCGSLESLIEEQNKELAADAQMAAVPGLKHEADRVSVPSSSLL